MRIKCHKLTPKPPKATTKPSTSHLLGRRLRPQSHSKATSKPPQSLLIVNRLRPQSHPRYEPGTSQGYIKVPGARAVPARSGPHGSQTIWFFEHPDVFLRAASGDGSRSDPELDAALPILHESRFALAAIPQAGTIPSVSKLEKPGPTLPARGQRRAFPSSA
jgi:hypothetical protein